VPHCPHASGSPDLENWLHPIVQSTKATGQQDIER